MIADCQIRYRTRLSALFLILNLAASPIAALAQQPAESWIGRRVVQRFNNFPLRLDGQAVLRSGMEIHIYRVQRRDGDQLWLEGDDDGPRGWATIDQLVPLEDALTFLSDRIRVHPDQAFYHALRAVVLTDRTDLDRALDDWNSIVELEPDDAASYIGRAKLALARMKWDAAISDLTRAIKIDPEDAYCYRVRAHAWCAKHDFDRAIDDCDRASKLEPDNASGLITRAQAWLGKQKYDNAIADTTEALRRDASIPLAYLYRGLAWSRKKDYDKAIADYDVAIHLDSEDAEFYYSRAWAWQQKGDKARAMADYAIGIGLDPTRENTRPEQGPTPADPDAPNVAVDPFLFKVPLEHVLPDPTAKASLAKARGAGVVPASFDPVPAPPTDVRRVKIGPGPDQPPTAEGAPASLSRDSFGIAEPQTALEFAARGGDWLRIQDYDKAIADCDRAIALGCHDPQARIYRGLAWQKKNEFDKAIADFDEAIRLDARSVFAYILRSSARTAKHEYDKAEADIALAAKIDPESPVIDNARAWMWATCPDAKYRDGRKSIDAATRACELTEWDEAGIIDTLAAGYAELGDFASAVKWQTRAIELETDAKDKADFVSRLKLYQDKKAYRDTKP